MTLYQEHEDGYAIYLKKNGADFKKSDWYILKEEDVTNIVRNVQNGSFCAIIGPPRSQKSYLLEVVNQKLENIDGTICVLLDLKDFGFVVCENILRKFANLFKTELQKHIKASISISPNEAIDKHSFKRFISKSTELINKNLVLLIDHVEKINTKPRKFIFQAFNEIKSEGNKRLSIVVNSSYSAIDENYCFRTNRNCTIKTGDLSPKASKKLIDWIFKQRKINITSDYRTYLLKYTEGDRHLISVLCNYTADEIGKDDCLKTVCQEDADNAIIWFLDEEAKLYQPLQKSIKAIEGDTSVMLSILQIIEQGKLELVKLQSTKWQPEFDKFLSTGAVKRESLENKDNYTIRNKIYENKLKQYFQPERVVNVLSSAGQWKKAVKYLENIISDNQSYNWIYLGTAVNSINADLSEEEGYALIIRAIKLVFSVDRVRIYIENSEKTKLVLFKTNATDKEIIKEISFYDKKYAIIINSYLKNEYLLTSFPPDDKVLLIPILKEESKKLGMVAISDFKFLSDDPEFLRLRAFLNRAGRAVGRVVDHKRKLNQLKALYEMGLEFNSRKVSQKEILRKTLKSIIEKSEVKASDILLLKDTHDPELCIKQKPLEHIPIGYETNPGEKIQPRYNGLTYKVLNNCEAVSVSNPETPPGINSAFLKRGIKACLCLPISIRKAIIGVIYLHYDEEHVFSSSEIEMLFLFSNQAAAALDYIRHFDRLTFLLKTSANLWAIDESGIALNSITKNFVDLLGAQRSLFLLINMKNRNLNLKGHHNYTKEHIEKLNYDELMKGASGKVMKSGKPFIHHNAQSEDVNTGESLISAKKFNTGPLIVAPIIIYWDRRLTPVPQYVVAS